MDPCATTRTVLEKVRRKRPLVHNITNYVVMNNTANALLALGASPIMAHAVEEVAELTSLCGALVLNIGTLSKPWIEAMFLAGNAARNLDIPVVLDPVGAGASALRTRTSVDLLRELRPAVVRGNASELMAVAGASGAVEPARLEILAKGMATRGVDSAHMEGIDAVRLDAVREVAESLARHAGCVAVASGAVDVVTDGKATFTVTGGDPLMPLVTGMGCTATAVVAACAAVEDHRLYAALAGMALMSAAGGMAARRAQGPGTLQLHFYDALYELERDGLNRDGAVGLCDRVTLERVG